MKLLLSSVFRPFGVDDEFGRKENKLELFHNQVTREQGIFSLRYNHRSFGLYFIAENLKMPTVVLDFPNLKQFRREVKKGYDYVGISFITSNFIKAKKMAEIVREVSPHTKIILGGHGTMIPDVEKQIENDYIIRGEGIYPLRKLFGEEVDAPIVHPVLPAADHKRIMGLPLMNKSVTLIPGLGCPNGCRFCATSHFFNKTYIPYYKTGQELMDVLVHITNSAKTNDIFVMDENFLKQKPRAMELFEIIQKEKRTFSFSIFSSAETISDFGIENMVKLGISFVWLGVESKNVLYEKTKGIDVKKLIADLRANGIGVLASSILFLDHHTKETIWEDIDFAIDLKPDFTQFMQFGPMPQTQLYLDYKEQGRLSENIPYEEWHGQHRLWFKHDHFNGEESEQILKEAFKKEYRMLGPSILRQTETLIRRMSSTLYQSGDPLLRHQNESLKKRCKKIYYALTALKMLVPTKEMKQYAESVINLYRKQLGRRSPLHFLASGFVVAFAKLEQLRCILGFESHQPKTMKTMHRMVPEVYKEMVFKIHSLFQSRHAWAIWTKARDEGVLSLHFSGKISPKITRSIIKRINACSNFSIKSIEINLTPLANFDEETFKKLLENLSKKCQDIKIYCSILQNKQLTILKHLVHKWGHVLVGLHLYMR